MRNLTGPIAALLGASSLLPPALSAQKAAAPVSLDALLDRAAALAQPLVDGKITVGLTIGVLHEGKVGVRGVGLVRKGAADVPDGDTLYEIGSISKVFTGILLAEAIDLGLVKVTDPVQMHLPKAVVMPRRGAKAITLQHLTTHTSGLPRMPDNFSPKDPTNPYADYDEKRLFECLPKLELASVPGERWAYSNLGVGLLGHVLARVHGKAGFAEILPRVTAPLGLRDTVIALSDEQRMRLALPYQSGGSAASNWDLDALAGAGAIRSTAKDLMEFARANLAAKASDGKIHSAMARSHEEQFKPGLAGRFQGGVRMGMGWMLRGGAVRHGGGTGGYRTHLMIDKARNLALTILANTTSGRTAELMAKVEALFVGRKVRPLKVVKPVAVPVETLRRYVGEYRMSAAVKFTVTLRDDELHVQLTGQQAFPVFGRSKTRFFYRVIPAEVEFDVDEKGKATALTLYQNGRETVAPRIE